MGADPLYVIIVEGKEAGYLNGTILFAWGSAVKEGKYLRSNFQSLLFFGKFVCLNWKSFDTARSKV